ncbi:glycosyltransferase family 4 protein [Bradyrhizobium sp. SSUT112]|uniref:glycosyltransferase family 4 protein n=1 Tax=Bradyrhizobium sp. SSUT112 TaxID=3040604 RepID=UPI00244AD03E|nr:glycosyltransferase family 4 protein [Bradyrhizobium sp. SSUT112]MDH2356822.1 glycosyltransferase family 4 protein [Bradyrhizobium sp. SSUT112]
MKVLVVNTLYPPHVVGGAEKSVKLLCESVVRAGVEVVVVSLHPGEGTIIETLNGVKVYRLPIDNVYWPFDQKQRSPLAKMQWHLRDVWNRAAGLRFSKVLEIEKPDVVHTNNLTGFSVALWASLRAQSLPIVHTLRDYSLLCRRATLFRGGQTCKRRCVDCAMMTMPSKSMSQYVDRVISNSRFVLDLHLANGYFRQAAGEVIYNIMEVGPERVEGPDTDSALTFGYIGKIDQDKGIEIILAATEKIQMADWKLKIAGRGAEDYVNKLKARYTDPRIEWLGFTVVRDVMRQIDVTIISSIWYEPLPRVLIESMAYRRSTICSTAGGIPEISHYADLIGEYEPTDVEALARLMEKAISGGRLAGTRRENGAGELPQLFSAPRIADRNIVVYRDALAR